jgi:outer membrane protein OmpA-like peptidoglycan-associated protein
MKTRSIILFFLIFVFSRAVTAQEDEIKDTPYFSGMNNFVIYNGEDIVFDSYNFYNGKNCVTVEGRIFKRHYTLKEDADKSSPLQIKRNYSNAIKSMGGTIIYDGEPQDAECADNNGRQILTGKAVKDGNELWIEVVPTGSEDYYMTIALKESMVQEVTANEIFEALNRDGHIALYINFDTGKSVIRDDSQPVIDQIVEMMKSNPDLKIGVEGHTDNVGNPASNKTLSVDRAKSVVAAIVSKGISSTRLSPSGYGQDKPVADNSTEEGRAKNRRVELIKIN